MVNDEDEYNGSTALILDHYFGNYIHVVWFYYNNNIQKSYEEIGKIKEEFCKGLELKIKKDLKEYAGITNQTLKNFLELGKSLDWLVKENLDLLRDKYSKLRQE